MTDPPATPATLAAALAAFQAELPEVTKTKTAKLKGQTKDGRQFDYTYKYADVADVNKAVMPLMGKLGLAFTCQPGERADGRLGVSYQLLHSSGEHIDGWFPIKSDLKMQDIGGSITYIRRYALCSLIGVAAEEDTDAQGIDAPRQERKPRGKPPIRPLDELPRNQDGSLSRSRCTEEELTHYGAMDSEQQTEHNELERDVLGVNSKGQSPTSTDRLGGTPPEDEWLDPPQRGLRPAKPAGKPVAVIHQYFTRYGYTDSPEDRAARLKRLSAIAGRPIGSTNDLTASEGIKVIRLLENCDDIAALDEALAVMAGEATEA